jgi:hypothetical protein
MPPIESVLGSHPLVRGIDRLQTGPLRIETVFLYPDGASIDLFITQDLSLFPSFRLTDPGQTMAWLLDLQVKPWLSRKRQGFLDDALRLGELSDVVAMSDRQTLAELLAA